MLVGINGQLGAGKDAFFERAQALASRGDIDLPATPQRRAFADKLKQAVASLLMVPVEYLERQKRDDTTLIQIRELRFGVSRVWGLRWTRHLPGFERITSSQTVRSAFQRMGTEVGRELFGDTFWVDQCVPADLDHSTQAIFVTDVRFPNEAERIKAAGGFVVRVHAGELNGDPHPSEQILDASLISLEVDNSVRDDDFANLDRQIKLLGSPKRGPKVRSRATQEAEKRQVIRTPRSVSSSLRIEGDVSDS